MTDDHYIGGDSGEFVALRSEGVGFRSGRRRTEYDLQQQIEVPENKELDHQGERREREEAQTDGDGQPVERQSEYDSSAPAKSPDEIIEEAKKRGDERREELVENAGPFFTIDEVARELGWSEKRVRQAVAERELYAVKTGETEFQFPRWQIEDGERIEGLQEVLDELLDYGWIGDLIFFECEHSLLGGDTPVDALVEGRIEAVRTCAAQEWRHGAA